MRASPISSVHVFSLLVILWISVAMMIRGSLKPGFDQNWSRRHSSFWEVGNVLQIIEKLIAAKIPNGQRSTWQSFGLKFLISQPVCGCGFLSLRRNGSFIWMKLGSFVSLRQIKDQKEQRQRIKRSRLCSGLCWFGEFWGIAVGIGLPIWGGLT